MRAQEHRAIADAAAAGALVNVGGEHGDGRFLLRYGDVVALSGDFFSPGPLPGQAAARDGDSHEAVVPGELFSVARVPGDKGTKPDTRDEIVCALRVMAVDEAFVDPRFEPGGEFADVGAGGTAGGGAVERRVRDRYLVLAAGNDDHFVAPGATGPTGSGAGGGTPRFGSAVAAYGHLHRVALDEALELGATRGDQSRGMAREAAAQHFLTDAFAAGHLRTPVAAIRRFWQSRHPAFWDNLQRRVASDTAAALRDASRALRLIPPRPLHDQVLSALRSRTGRYPRLSFGDLVARAFHDWDNAHGLRVAGGGVVFGDGHLDGATERLALAAVQAGIDDVEVAFRLGAGGSTLRGEALYGEVRAATGAAGDTFRAESMIPRPSPANPAQNWQAADVEALWTCPMVGSTGPTVGEALTDMLEPAGRFIRQLDCLGQGLAESHPLLALPVLGSWLSHRCCHAYHQGFVEPLARDPRRVVLDVVHGRPASPP